MPTIDDIRATAERISGNPTSGDVRLFIDDLIHALDFIDDLIHALNDEQPDSDAIPVTELREQPRLQ
jgi:hypothetical protein